MENNAKERQASDDVNVSGLFLILWLGLPFVVMFAKSLI